jgi:hypothetical protein
MTFLIEPLQYFKRVAVDAGIGWKLVAEYSEFQRRRPDLPQGNLRGLSQDELEKVVAAFQLEGHSDADIDIGDPAPAAPKTADPLIGRPDLSHCVPQGWRHDATSLRRPEHHQRVDISPCRVIECERQTADDRRPRTRTTARVSPAARCSSPRG